MDAHSCRTKVVPCDKDDQWALVNVRFDQGLDVTNASFLESVYGAIRNEVAHNLLDWQLKVWEAAGQSTGILVGEPTVKAAVVSECTFRAGNNDLLFLLHSITLNCMFQRTIRLAWVFRQLHKRSRMFSECLRFSSCVTTTIYQVI